MPLKKLQLMQWKLFCCSARVSYIGLPGSRTHEHGHPKLFALFIRTFINVMQNRQTQFRSSGFNRGVISLMNNSYHNKRHSELPSFALFTLLGACTLQMGEHLGYCQMHLNTDKEIQNSVQWNTTYV